MVPEPPGRSCGSPRAPVLEEEAIAYERGMFKRRNRDTISPASSRAHLGRAPCQEDLIPISRSGQQTHGRERSEGRQPGDGEARIPVRGHQTPKLTCFALALRKFGDGAHHPRTDRPGAFAPPIRQGKGPGVRAQAVLVVPLPPPPTHSLRLAPASGGSCPCFPGLSAEMLLTSLPGKSLGFGDLVFFGFILFSISTF